ncbi:MAG: hypothetical protein NTW86_04505 [Candidatus Sumerlaeota bacterium]|nr:hypothetical protein [Candidatus Sumerlaeota bacterium]
MGTCCFTPRKTHFLWWYWLLLASVVGIPMLLAALYVFDGGDWTEEEMLCRGRRAGRVFWIATLVLLWLETTFGIYVISAMVEWSIRGVPVAPGSPTTVVSDGDYEVTAVCLLFDFVCCFLMANLAVALAHKRMDGLARAMVTLAFLILWALVSAFSWLLNPLGLLLIPGVNLEGFYPFMLCLMFAVMLVPAHFWRLFIAKPEPATARRAFAAFLVSSVLFYGVARYGQVAHFYIYDLARGKAPTAAEAAPYRMN